MTFGGGEEFGKVFADNSGGETQPCGEKPEVMAAVQVKTTGLKADQWRYWTMLDLVESAWTLFENGEGGGMGVTGVAQRIGGPYSRVRWWCWECPSRWRLS